MHIVHHSSFYTTLDNAVHQEEGLAVLGFLFKVDFHSFLDLKTKHLSVFKSQAEVANLPNLPA